VDTQRLRYTLLAGLSAALLVPAAAHIHRAAARVGDTRDGAVRVARAPRRRAALAELDVESQQPSVIYADARAFSFNTGFGSTVRPDLLVSLGTPRGPVRDDGTWEIAFAKTVTFFFAPDSANTRVPGAFALWREVNAAAPQVLVRNVLPDTLPFFAYKCAKQDPSGDSLSEVPSERLPITFADTSESGIDAQSIRAVELHFLVTNGEHGSAQRVERVSVLAMLPGAGQAVQPVAGDRSGPVAGLASQRVEKRKEKRERRT
jgi:hypothetical protein